jgi:hypothetical protein
VLRADARYPRAAVRWHARFASDVPLTLSESQLVLSALARLADREPAAAVSALERTFAAHDRRATSQKRDCGGGSRRQETQNR